jgi:hypothetical protein
MEEVSNMLEFLAEMIKKGLLIRGIDILLILGDERQHGQHIFSFQKIDLPRGGATRAQSHEMQNQRYHRSRGTIGR